MQLISNSIRKPFLVLMSLCVLFTGMIVACSPANPASSQIESIGQIAEAKTSAHEGILLVRQYVSDAESWEYIEARELYGEAQAEFNGWIEQLKADITFSIEPDVEQYDATLASAIQKTEDFLKHVEQVEQAHSGSGRASSSNQEGDVTEREDVSAALILGLTTAIVKEVIVEGGLELWRANQELQVQEQAKHLEYLDTLLWESFENIK